MVKPAGPVKDRAYSKDVTLNIGMLSCIGDLFTLQIPNAGEEEKLKLVCPECAGEIKVVPQKGKGKPPVVTGGPTVFPSQKYKCADNENHALFTIAEAGRGKMIDGKIVVMDAEAIAEAAKSELPEKEFDLQVHLAADVEQYTFDAGVAYVFKPSGKSKFYGVLVDVLKKRPDICFLAKTNLRKTDHLIRVDVGLNDNLIIRDMIWPEYMKSFSKEDWDYPASLLTQAEMLIDASVEPFKPEEYRKDSRARIGQVIADAAAGPQTAKSAQKAVKAPVGVDEDDALGKALAAALAAKKAS